MASSEKVNAGKDGIVDNNRPSSPEGSEGQNEDVVLGIDLTYGPETRRMHWKCGIRIHTDLYCRRYKREIEHNDTKCPSFSPLRPIFRTIRATKKNGYQEHKEYLISCSTCNHSIKNGLQFRKI